MTFFRTSTALIILLTLATPLFAAPPPPQEPREIVARVNGEPVYLDELAPLIREDRKAFGRMGGATNTPAMETRLRERALEKYLAQLLLEQEAAKVKVSDLEKKVDERLKQLPHPPKAEEMEKTRDNLRRQVRLEEYFKKEGLSDPEVTEAQVREYYTKNKENFSQKERVEVRHILVTLPPDAGEKEVAEATKKIDLARQRIEKGEDFGKVAEEMSDCNSAKGGGRLGPVERGFMPPEFEKVAFSLPPNKLGPTVRTQFGFHLMEVTERHEAGITPFEKMKDFLTTYLKQQKGSAALAQHLKELRSRAKIETVAAEKTAPKP